MPPWLIGMGARPGGTLPAAACSAVAPSSARTRLAAPQPWVPPPGLPPPRHQGLPVWSGQGSLSSPCPSSLPLHGHPRPRHLCTPRAHTATPPHPTPSPASLPFPSWHGGQLGTWGLGSHPMGPATEDQGCVGSTEVAGPPSRAHSTPPCRSEARGRCEGSLVRALLPPPGSRGLRFLHFLAETVRISWSAQVS